MNDLPVRRGSPRPLPPERVALDGRRPWHLDAPGLVLQVTAGHVDLFALPSRDGIATGARRHLFRAVSGDLILGLPHDGGDAAAARIEIIAVGGQNAEAIILDRHARIERARLEAWLAALGAAIVGTTAGRDARDAQAGTVIALGAGQSLHGPARRVAWLKVEQGAIRPMDSPISWQAEDGALALASGMWVEAIEDASVAVLAGDALDPLELWPAIDRFHDFAMACLARRIAAEAAADARMIGQRAELASAQADRLFHTLAAVVVPRHAAVARERDGADPLFAACRLVAEAMGAAMTTAPPARSGQTAWSRIAEIARAAQLRSRRTLLRAGWWRRNVGPLVAWQGEARRPVAIIPASPRRYDMVDPETGARRRIDAAAAAELSPDAAMFYHPLPARALAARDLLALAARSGGGDVARIVFAALAMGVLALAGPLVTEVLVDSIIPRADLGQLGFCAAALAMVALGTAGFQAAQGVAIVRLGGTLDWLLQAAVVDRLLALPVGFFRRFTIGDLTNRTLAIEAMRQLLTGRAVGGVLAGVFCLFGFALMFYFAPGLALIAVALTALRAAAVLGANLVRLRHERRHTELNGKVEGLVLQFLTGIGKLRIAAAATRALEVWAIRFAEQKRHFIAAQRAANALAVFEAAFPICATLIIFAAARRANGLILDMGEFLAFFAAFGQTLAAVGGLAAAIGESLIALPYLDRLRPLLAETREITAQRNTPGELSGALELGHVTFRYDESGPPILDRVTIRVRKSEYVALVGASGSGKSTVFRLLLGFEKPQSGTVLFDGEALDTLDVAAVRRQIGVVLQNGRLVTGSIYDNICGGVSLPIERAWEAARHAGLDADIEAMPMGLHTLITEGMSTLSGGQRQRLMIARALVHRPRILLFDEATSALDNRTQAIVSASLARLDVTRLVIAHRLSTVQGADRIIVLAGGAVVQDGSFAALSAVPGPFADLAKRQLI